MTLVAEPPVVAPVPDVTVVPKPPAPAMDETRTIGVGPLLATMIRKGCRLSPYQAVNQLFGVHSSCVMGALYEGLMGTREVRAPVVDAVLERTGVDLSVMRVPHPLFRPPTRAWKLNEVLVDLNDRRDWSREQIADWVEKALP